MKKLFRTGIALSLATFLFVSCSKDDNNNNNNNNDKQKNELGGTVKKGEKLTLDSKITYNLTSKLVVEDGGTLTIPAGTTIVGKGGTSSYIAVAQGGKIFVEGTKDKPVVMTAEIKKRGSWGGLVLCGKAPINKGTTATAEVSDLTYGGTVANDNSGSIRFLRIEYAGAIYNADKEFNGLTFFGVGSGTTIEYVQAHEGSDDGFEFFGGTVNTKYLVSTHNDDDQFDWTEGWTGTNENWFSKQSGVADKGFEADNNSKNHDATPISFPTIKNITLIGADTPPVDGKPRTGLHFRVGTKANVENIYLQNFKIGVLVENDATVAGIGKDLIVKNIQFDKVETKTKITNNKGEAVTKESELIKEGTATGAGNGAATPDWAKGWTVGL